MTTRRQFITLLAAGAALPLAAQAQAPFDHGYAAWDALLKKHVRWLPDGKQSRANYKGFAAYRTALKGVLDTLSAVPRASFDGWSRPQQMAFLINAYNGSLSSSSSRSTRTSSPSRSWVRCCSRPGKRSFSVCWAMSDIWTGSSTNSCARATTNRGCTPP